MKLWVRQFFFHLFIQKNCIYSKCPSLRSSVSNLRGQHCVFTMIWIYDMKKINISLYLQYCSISRYIVTLLLYRDTYRIARFLPKHRPYTATEAGLRFLVLGQKFNYISKRYFFNNVSWVLHELKPNNWIHEKTFMFLVNRGSAQSKTWLSSSSCWCDCFIFLITVVSDEV